MVSVDECLSKTLRAVRSRLGSGYRRWFEKYGPPSETSPLSSLHFLLAEYQEPPPFAEARPYKGTLGPYPVLRRRLSIASPEKKRKLRVDLAFPESSSAELPAVLISPGLGAHPNATRYMEDHLASHGYLIARPTHRGSDWLGAALRTPLGAFTRTELRQRISEVELTLEALFEGRFGFCPQEGKVCLAGHSFGALTNGLLAGLRAKGIEVAGKYPVKALVVLSPYGNSFPTQRLGIDPASFGNLSMPVLFVSGTKDDLWTLGKGARSHLEPYLVCRSPIKSHLLIGGTKHGNFSEIFGWVRHDTKVMVNSTVTAFLDAHLLDNADSLNYLNKELSLVAFEHGSWVLS